MAGFMNLVIGNAISGNAFEVMFLCAADFVHEGSIAGAMTRQDHTTALIAMLITAVLLIGMVRRQKTGPGMARGQTAPISEAACCGAEQLGKIFDVAQCRHTPGMMCISVSSES